MPAIRNLLALLVATLLVSCGLAGQGYHFAPGVTPVQRALVHRAMDAINEQVLPDIQVYEAPPGDEDVWHIEFADQIIGPEYEFYTGVTCMEHREPSESCPNGSRRVRIRRGLPDDLTVVVSEHELLHSVGLRHVSNKAAIMSPSPKETSVWTDDDTAECQRAGACAAVMGRDVH